jgi:5-methylcytosine-specific restriction enzyme subunit McrC
LRPYAGLIDRTMIPIGNLYYMLCYAWNRLDERDLVDTSALPRQDLPNLLARILATGLRRLLRQGIYRSYVALHEDTRNPRGKINVTDSIKRGLEYRGFLSCSIDELSSDVAHNRILRATVRQLGSSDAVAPSLAHELRLLERQLQAISAVSVRSSDFARVQLHRNNAFYHFLLNVCELAFHCLLAEEKPGRFRFVISCVMRSVCGRCSRTLSTTSTTPSSAPSPYPASELIGTFRSRIRAPASCYPI